MKYIMRAPSLFRELHLLNPDAAELAEQIISIRYFLADKKSFKHANNYLCLIDGWKETGEYGTMLRNSFRMRKLDKEVSFYLDRFIKIFKYGYAPSLEGLTPGEILFGNNPNKRPMPKIITA